jgi:hypothetical protein
MFPTAANLVRVFVKIAADFIVSSKTLNFGKGMAASLR